MTDALDLQRRSPRNDQQHPRNLLCLDDGRNLRERSDGSDNSDYHAGGMPMRLITLPDCGLVDHLLCHAHDLTLRQVAILALSDVEIDQDGQQRLNGDLSSGR
jgi:hypothetical protein